MSSTGATQVLGYLQHKLGCEYLVRYGGGLYPDDTRACTCGLESLLTALRSLPPAPSQQVAEDAIEGLVAMRDVIAALGKQAGYLPQQQAYSTVMTPAERQAADAVRDGDVLIDSLRAALRSLASPSPAEGAAG